MKKKMTKLFSRNKTKMCSILTCCYLLVFCYLCLFLMRNVSRESKTEMTNYPIKIRNFTQFLNQYFDNRVINYTMKPLTKLGDSFGGILQFVNIQLLRQNNSDEVSFVIQVLLYKFCEVFLFTCTFLHFI